MRIFIAQFILSVITIGLCGFLILTHSDEHTEKYWLGITNVLSYWMPAPSIKDDNLDDD